MISRIESIATKLLNGASMVAVVAILFFFLNTFSGNLHGKGEEVRSNFLDEKVGILRIDKDNALDIKQFEERSEIGGYVLLDVRERERYIMGHVHGAINIPISEIRIRAPKEIPAGKMTIIDCGYNTKCEAANKEAGRLTPCTLAARILKDELGFKNVKILAAEKKEISLSGMRYESSEMLVFE